jgi:hypothetical protein
MAPSTIAQASCQNAHPMPRPLRVTDTKSPPEPGTVPSRWREHGALIAGAAVVTVVLAALALQQPTGADGDGVEEGMPPPPLPAGPDVTTLLDGLAVGDALGAFKVTSIDLANDEVMRRAIAVGLAHQDGHGFTLWIARPGVHSFTPFESTERYGFYHGHYHPPGTGPTEAEIAAVAGAIVPRVRKVEATVPVPAGL